MRVDGLRVAKVLCKSAGVSSDRKSVFHTINVLTQAHKLLVPSRQLGQCQMRSVRLHVHSHVSPIAVELPYQARICAECLRSRQADRIMCPP